MLLSTEEEINLSDETFDTIMENFENKLDIYIKNMLEDYISYYISIGFRMSSITKNKLDVLANTAVSFLNGDVMKLYDLQAVKEKLEYDYNLRIIDNNITDLESL